MLDIKVGHAFFNKKCFWVLRLCFLYIVFDTTLCSHGKFRVFCPVLKRSLNSGVPFVKIGSGDVNNCYVLNKIAEMTEVNAVVSTGMANFDMVENIYNMFKKCRGNLNNFVIMQCTSSYPTESKGKNLQLK